MLGAFGVLEREPPSEVLPPAMGAAQPSGPLLLQWLGAPAGRQPCPVPLRAHMHLPAKAKLAVQSSIRIALAAANSPGGRQAVAPYGCGTASTKVALGVGNLEHAPGLNPDRGHDPTSTRRRLGARWCGQVRCLV